VAVRHDRKPHPEFTRAARLRQQITFGFDAVAEEQRALQVPRRKQAVGELNCAFQVAAGAFGRAAFAVAQRGRQGELVPLLLKLHHARARSERNQADHVLAAATRTPRETQDALLGLLQRLVRHRVAHVHQQHRRDLLRVLGTHQPGQRETEQAQKRDAQHQREHPLDHRQIRE
jgi:hypothetical protein